MIHLGVPWCAIPWHRRIDSFWHYRVFALGMTMMVNNVRFIKGFQLDEVIFINPKSQLFDVWSIFNCVLAIMMILI